MYIFSAKHHVHKKLSHSGPQLIALNSFQKTL